MCERVLRSLPKKENFLLLYDIVHACAVVTDCPYFLLEMLLLLLQLLLLLLLLTQAVVVLLASE